MLDKGRGKPLPKGLRGEGLRKQAGDLDGSWPRGPPDFKILNYRFGMKTQNIIVSDCDKNLQKETKMIKKWTHAHTSVFGGIHVCKDREHKMPFGAKTL